jgi:hypothetical protein
LKKLVRQEKKKLTTLGKRSHTEMDEGEEKVDKKALKR